MYVYDDIKDSPRDLGRGRTSMCVLVQSCVQQTHMKGGREGGRNGSWEGGRKEVQVYHNHFLMLSTYHYISEM